MPAKTPSQPPRNPHLPATADPRLTELAALIAEISGHVKRTCHVALRIGLRILSLSGDETTRRAAIAAVTGQGVPESTAYRWTNAAAQVLMRAQGAESPRELRIPSWDAKSAAWRDAEAFMEQAANGMSLRRILIGGPAAGSDETRLDELITRAERGDEHADKMLEEVAAGRLTLVQAIRAAAGAAATKGKTRTDPVYLDLDGVTGQPVGLFPKCLVTLSNTFARWNDLDESARHAARSAWKALVANLPKELR